MLENLIYLGVLGADDSVCVIQRIAEEMGNFVVTPVVYSEEDEIPEKVGPVLSSMDAWLCSGQVPHAILSETLRCDKPVFYTHHSGEGLLRALLFWVHERGVRISQMSFDTLSESTMDRLFADIGIQCDYYLKHYRGPIHSDELVEFHRTLWEKGVTRVAITCLRSAHIKLEALGIPSTHITPTTGEVRQVLETVRRTYELQLSQDARVVVQLLRKSPPDSDNLDLELEKSVRRYANFLHGTFQQITSDTWAVYTTLGVAAEITDSFRSRPSFESLAKTSHITVWGGIGSGLTMQDATDRARLALQQAELCPPGSWACALADNTLIAPLGKDPHRIAVAYGREDLQKLSGEIPLSDLTLTKIAGVLAEKKSSQITVRELAQHLHIMPRSARRLLLTLEEHGLAQVVGEESGFQRGRPRKVYEIHF